MNLVAYPQISHNHKTEAIAGKCIQTAWKRYIVVGLVTHFIIMSNILVKWSMVTRATTNDPWTTTKKNRGQRDPIKTIQATEALIQRDSPQRRCFLLLDLPCRISLYIYPQCLQVNCSGCLTVCDTACAFMGVPGPASCAGATAPRCYRVVICPSLSNFSALLILPAGCPAVVWI